MFLTVALFNGIRANMAGYFPYAVTSTAETKVSIRRIQVIKSYVLFEIVQIIVIIKLILLSHIF